MEVHSTEKQGNEQDEQKISVQAELDQQQTVPMPLNAHEYVSVPASDLAGSAEQDTEEQPARHGVRLRPEVRRRRRHSKLKWLLLCDALLLMALLIGGLAIHLPTEFGRQGRVLASNYPHMKPPLQVDSATSSFMDAMMHKQWGRMWFMLSVEAQQLWHSEQDFIHFEQAKFGSIRFVSYAVSTAQMFYNWLDPDTTYVYSLVASRTISLDGNADPGVLTTPSDEALKQGLFHNCIFALVEEHGQWRVLVAGPADLDAPILVPAKAPVTKILVPIFMYHHVSNQATHNILDYSLTVTTSDFNAQLDWLQKQGYTSINQTELFDALYYGKILPPHPMMLTFDDGYEDVYTDAFPALLAHHYRGVFYIITGMIGGRYMSWEQIRILAREGMQISSHTVHHINVGEPPAYTSTQSELLQSKEVLEKQLGQPMQFFCYPSGEPFHHDTYAEQQMVLSDLFADGYVGATLDPLSFNGTIQDAQTPYQLQRIRVSGGEPLDAFISILNVTLQNDQRLLKYGAMV
ncbi:MAG TPA: polysaccharide deacetylase family protein [Ktedonobacteraceae bacterium]|nr:polysaccharide deacetylase family protein [Ktedonobacteraceae bacterium]